MPSTAGHGASPTSSASSRVLLSQSTLPPVGDIIRQQETLRAAMRIGLSPAIYASKYPYETSAVLLIGVPLDVRQTRARRRAFTLKNRASL